MSTLTEDDYVITEQDIIRQLTSWQECFETADKVNDLANMDLYAKKLTVVHVWFIQNGWVEAR